MEQKAVSKVTQVYTIPFDPGDEPCVFGSTLEMDEGDIVPIICIQNTETGETFVLPETVVAGMIDVYVMRNTPNGKN